uniref:YqaJ viral recombinase domain-containing protein n=1 Tax=Kalanchoe fedtschenkoi TaxID=63787 RepID=A0A7N0U2M3_KALFE
MPIYRNHHVICSRTRSYKYIRYHGNTNFSAVTEREEPGEVNSYFRTIYSEHHPIIQSSSLQHWFKNWQEQRKHKLTASTFASAVGFWRRRRTQLWLEKIGAIEPFAGNLATCWNNIKEEEAVERYKLITGNSVFFPEFQVYRGHKCDDWLAASPDGVVDYHVYGLPSGGLLEIKCPFFGGDMRKASPWVRIPLHHIPQAQGLMEIMDRDWMDFYVWTPRGSSLFRLYRDLEYWDTLKVALSDFWLDNVEPARAVYKRRVIKEPLYELRAFRPNSRHDLCGYIVQESRHIVDSSKLLLREINGIVQMDPP